ncbi:MAG: hypothetical protein ACK4SY_10260 [Pyrobaculum sp.]
MDSRCDPNRAMRYIVLIVLIYFATLLFIAFTSVIQDLVVIMTVAMLTTSFFVTSRCMPKT